MEINSDTDKIIKCQSIVRGFLARKKLLICSAEYQTKDWRKNQSWYLNGKKNECEIYQRDLVEKITKQTCHKTYDRINMEHMAIQKNVSPFKNKDGFEWTENFDGKQCTKNKNTIYYNLKMVCDQGGAQTRTLREVYSFVKCQLKLIKKYNPTNLYFINILDGDEANRKKENYSYLLSKYKEYSKYVFVGDMKEFQDWFNKYPTI